MARYLAADDAGQLAVVACQAASAEPMAPRLEELWHNVWIFIGLMLFLAAEWMLRRRWGLR